MTSTVLGHDASDVQDSVDNIVVACMGMACIALISMVLGMYNMLP